MSQSLVAPPIARVGIPPQLPGATIVPRGEYNIEWVYRQYDQVLFLGSSYVKNEVPAPAGTLPTNPVYFYQSAAAGSPATPFRLFDDTEQRTLAERFAESVSVFEKIPGYLADDIRAGTSTVDVSGYIQEVIAKHRSVRRPPGKYRLASQIIIPDGQSFFTEGGTGESVFEVDPDFDDAASLFKVEGFDAIGDLSVYKGGGVIDLGQIRFLQPANTDITRAQLRHFPVALDMRNVWRAIIPRLRLVGAWDGIDASYQIPGCWFGDLEMGCFNSGLRIGDTGDFVHLRHLNGWPHNFGSGGLPNWEALLRLYQDGVATLFELGRCDGFDAFSITSFGQRIKLLPLGGPGAAKHAAAIQLDGNNAVLEDAAPNFACDYLSSTKNSALPNPPSSASYTKSGGKSRFGIFRFFGFNEWGPDVDITGGSVEVAQPGLETKALGQPAMRINPNARVVMGPGLLDPGVSAVRTAPYILQKDGGALHMVGLGAVGIGTGSGILVEVTNDNAGNHIVDNNFAGWDFKIPFGFKNGCYGYNRVKAQKWTPTITFVTPGNNLVVTYLDPEADYRSGTFRYSPTGIDFDFFVALSSITYDGTTQGNLVINGLPFPPVGYPLAPLVRLGPAAKVLLNSGYTKLDAYIGGTGIQLRQTGSGLNIGLITTTNVPSGTAGLNLSGDGSVNSI